MNTLGKYVDTAYDQVERGGYIEPGELIIGTFDQILDDGNALVSYQLEGVEHCQKAIATVDLTPQKLKRQVVLTFKGRDIFQPIVLGFLFSPLNQLFDTYNSEKNIGEVESNNTEDQVVFSEELPEKTDLSSPEQVLQVDGKRIIIEGEEEVVLMCGDASITLSKSGKIAIRGKYLLSRADGVNRILGGAVQVN